uniref:Uncharacterized protein n=1 Tax=Gallus gallus TaxID=9031 RepID=A0A8V0XB53_CHICK
MKLLEDALLPCTKTRKEVLWEFPSHPSHYLASPPYKPKLKAQTTLIIFTVTRDRLEEQLLAEEQFPDLENHKNIRVAAKWLGTLEKLLEQYSEESHSDFHVFISTEPAPGPEEHVVLQGILEDWITITRGAPTRMLANLYAALHSFDQDTLELCGKEQEFKSILFSLRDFHTHVASGLF